MADERVLEAVLEAFGVSSAPAVSPEDAAAAVVDELAVAHANDLSVGERDLEDRLSARLGPSVLHDPRALTVIDSVLSSDEAAHAVARGLVHGDLVDAFRGAPAGREQAVGKILESERARVRARAGTRVARATQRMLASIRLPDEAFDAPREAA